MGKEGGGEAYGGRRGEMESGGNERFSERSAFRSFLRGEAQSTPLLKPLARKVLVASKGLAGLFWRSTGSRARAETRDGRVHLRRRGFHFALLACLTFYILRDEVQNNKKIMGRREKGKSMRGSNRKTKEEREADAKRGSRREERGDETKRKKKR